MSDTAEPAAPTPAWNPGYTDPLDMPVSLNEFLSTLRQASDPDLIFGRVLAHRHKYTAASLKVWRERLEAVKAAPIPVTETRQLTGPRRR